MGIYLNPGNGKFARDIRSEIYVDKTGLIAYTNKVINTAQEYVCVSRPRRFGKSMAANMLAAYYGRNCDSKELFGQFEIAKEKSYLEHLNRYDVLFLNMQEFLSRTNSMGEMILLLKRKVRRDLLSNYPDADYFDPEDLIETMQDIYQHTHIPFVVIIDEWDCIFREYKEQKEAQKQYLDFLRDLLKDKEYIYLAYMTGILPIKKYGTHSALNMFDEFSMTNPRQLAKYVGFTEHEVQRLCGRYGMEETLMKEWYDGYHFPNHISVYSPKSVIQALLSGVCDDYWNQTETFEALRIYIDMNYDGLRDGIISMMSGSGVYVNTGSFVNDMATFHTKDDVLTLLVHLGYLAYDFENKRVRIPNSEIYHEYVNAVTVSDWGEVTEALKASADTLDAVLSRDEEKVASAIETAHFETSHIQYNDENALSYAVSLALYAARNYYTVHREFPSGKGFADMVFLPRKKFPEKPALIVELKWDKAAEGALAQIRERKYTQSLEKYRGKILLVGISYNKKTKEHACRIEEADR